MANIFTSAAETLLRNYVAGDATPPATWYIGWGTGGAAAEKASTTLSTEAAESRVAATTSEPAANQNRGAGEITAAAGKTITNAGVLTASTSGTLWLMSDFTGVLLDTGDKINFTWTITWG